MADEIEAVAVKDQLWWIEVVKLSEVDSGGNMEMVFDIIDNNTGEVLHPAMVVNGSPGDIKERARVVAAELRLKKEQAEVIKVGDKFEV